jgi:hypothetical protein
MATVKDNDPQLSTMSSAGATQRDPTLARPGPVPEGGTAAFIRGQMRGRELAGLWRRRLAAWAEENPGQLLVAGLFAGFVAGKVFRRPRRIELDID